MTKDCEAQVETLYHFESRIGLANSPQEEVGNFIAEEYRENAAPVCVCWGSRSPSTHRRVIPRHPASTLYHPTVNQKTVIHNPLTEPEIYG